MCVQSIMDEGWIRLFQIMPIAPHGYYMGPPRTILTLQQTDEAEL